MPVSIEPQSAASFTLKKRKAIEASAEEVQENTRSRSAKLRVAVRNDVVIEGVC